jgi:hypothetical protein
MISASYPLDAEIGSHPPKPPNGERFNPNVAIKLYHNIRNLLGD